MKLEEIDIREWFSTVDLEQAIDTYNVVTGIIDYRKRTQPKRKKRSDAGRPRASGGQNLIDLKELCKP